MSRTEAFFSSREGPEPLGGCRVWENEGRNRRFRSCGNGPGLFTIDLTLASKMGLSDVRLKTRSIANPERLNNLSELVAPTDAIVMGAFGSSLISRIFVRVASLYNGHGFPTSNTRCCFSPFLASRGAFIGSRSCTSAFYSWRATSATASGTGRIFRS